MAASEEEVQKMLMKSDVSRKGPKFEIANKILGGNIIILEEDKPNELTQKDLENIENPKYLVEKFGPISNTEEFTKNANRQYDVKELDPTISSHGRSSFSAGMYPKGILHSKNEYEERILEAYAQINNIELSPDSANGTSFAMLLSLKHELSDFKNHKKWLKYRDPEGYSGFYKNNNDKNIRAADSPKELAEMTDSSLHFAKGLYKAINEE